VASKGETAVAGKRQRRTNAAIRAIKDRLRALLAEQRPATVRGLFYLAETGGLVPKTQQGYNAVDRYLIQMREEGEVPFAWIADHTRWTRKPASYASPEEALEELARTYRKDPWQDQPAYVEIWCEKDALVGVLYQETRAWDVPLMVSRGFTSLTFVYEAAQALLEVDKPAHIYYFGDHDPSGVAVDRAIERRLRQFAPGADIHFTRVAVLPEQVTEWKLPTRLTKKSDSRSRTFRGDSVEIDAVPPTRLRQLVRECIVGHIDWGVWKEAKAEEKEEREGLQRLVERLG